MRRAQGFLLSSMLLAATTGVVSCDSESSGPTSPAHFVVPADATVELGKPFQFRQRSALRLKRWSVLGAAGNGIISEGGLYRAPFNRPASSSATVQAEYAGYTASASVEFGPSPPDPQDCCGPGQSRLPEPDEFVYVDELPEALVRVAPWYPDTAREQGVQGTVLLQALVCSTGQVFAVRAQQSIPLLDFASIMAARQWVFQPARVDGRPVAVWVTIPVKFSLHEPSGAMASVLPLTPASSPGQSSRR
jgi:protein TonB